MLNPVVSVVIPNLNGAQHLAAQLSGLSRQDYGGAWEVILADNGSTDTSRDVAREWKHALPSFQLVDASEKRGATFARNAGTQASQGELVAYCDADDIVHAGWLTAIVRALSVYDLVGGRLEYATLNDDRTRGIRNEILVEDLPVLMGYLPFVSSANMGVRRAIFDEIGGWDDDFPSVGCDDVDFSWRVQQAGRVIGFEPEAVVSYRLKTGNLANARQVRRYAEGDVLLHKKHGPAGARRRRAKGVAYSWMMLIIGSWKALSNKHRGRWLVRLFRHFGYLSGTVKHRHVYI